MNIWRKILGKSKKQYIDSLTISDWLANMSEAFTRTGSQLLTKNPASPSMLAHFTILNAISSTYNLLHFCPESHQNIGAIFKEFRLYYECLWQNCLLQERKSESDKIGKLYALVDISTCGLFNALFKENPNIKRLFEVATDENYYDSLRIVLKAYIHGDYSANLKARDFQDLTAKNIYFLSSRLSITMNRRNDQKLVNDLVKQVTDDLEKAIK